MDYRGEPELRDVIDTLLAAGADPDKANNSGNSPRKMVLLRNDNTIKTGKNPEWDLQPHLRW
jgi:hypothetical protein